MVALDKLMEVAFEKIGHFFPPFANAPASGLTPNFVNPPSTRMEVFDSTKDENGKKHISTKARFTGAGMISPIAEQSLKPMKKFARIQQSWREKP